MCSSPLYAYLLPLLLAVVSCATAPSGLEPAAGSAIAASSGPWLQYADVRQAGFDRQALRAVCERADRLQSGALMAVFRGHVILACGDVDRPFEAHSVRKSLVSGLYGTAVAQGEIDLDATLADFVMDERTPLTATERSATIYQYPQLHADVSTITWVIPRAAFYDYLEALVRAGLGKRLMLGSDQMRWPERSDKGLKRSSRRPS